MTSRMHAPHTTCPGCREVVYLDELVRGRCPLCGCTLEDFDSQESEIEDFIERSDLPWLVFNYFLFKRFLEIGASPLQIMQAVAAFNDQDLQGNGQKPDTRFVMEVPMKPFDRHTAEALCQVREDLLCKGKESRGRRPCRSRAGIPVLL